MHFSISQDCVKKKIEVTGREVNLLKMNATGIESAQSVTESNKMVIKTIPPERRV